MYDECAMHDPAALQNSLKVTIKMLDKVGKRLSWEDRNKSYLALKAVLEVLRNRLPLDLSLSLGASLPLLMRSFYYVGWSLEDESSSYTKEEFISDVERKLGLPLEGETEEVIAAVFNALEPQIGRAVIRSVKETLPEGTFASR